MKKTIFAILGATSLSLAACASEEEAAEAAADETLVDESYDENATSLDEAMAEMPEAEEVVAEEPAAAPAPSPEIEESDVMAEDPETEDVVGL